MSTLYTRRKSLDDDHICPQISENKLLCYKNCIIRLLEDVWKNVGRRCL